MVWTSDSWVSSMSIGVILCLSHNWVLGKGWEVVKNSPANAGNARDVCLIPGLRRSPGIGNGNPLQYSCLKNPMNRGTYSSWGHKASDAAEWLSTRGENDSLFLLFAGLQSKGTVLQYLYLQNGICKPAFLPQSHFYDIILDFKLTLHWGSWEGDW